MKKNESRSLTIDFYNEAVDTIVAMKEITGREKSIEVVSDALKIYLNILFAQAFAKGYELENFVKDKKAAQEYFHSIGWV